MAHDCVPVTPPPAPVFTVTVAGPERHYGDAPIRRFACHIYPAPR